MYWIWETSSREHVRHLAHHAQYDRRRHLLRHVYRPRHRSDPIAGLVQTPVPRKGECCITGVSRVAGGGAEGPADVVAAGS